VIVIIGGHSDDSLNCSGWQTMLSEMYLLQLRRHGAFAVHSDETAGLSSTLRTSGASVW
jgi:hypothetical protein